MSFSTCSQEEFFMKVSVLMNQLKADEFVVKSSQMSVE